MNDKELKDKLSADALNECVETILAGREPVDSCLQRYPEQAEELRPLLETIKATRDAASVSPDPDFRARARYDFHRAMSEQFEPSALPRLSLRLRWATAVSTLGVFLLAGGGGVMAASANSMPGQYLYGVKRTVENAQVSMAPSQAAKARLYAGLADERVSEIVFAAQLGDVALTEDLTRQFASDLSMVSTLASYSRTSSFGNDSKAAGSTNTMAGSSPEQSVTTAAPTTTMTAPLAPSIMPPTSTSRPSPGITITSSGAEPATAVNLSGITDPVLLKLLQQYSVKNVSELMAILDKVPPSVRAALLSAIQTANNGYGQILGS